MDPATIAVLLGAVAASSASNVYTNSQNIKYAQEANSESVALANTAHQREVRDLRAAGLNPILSASGSGAAVPQLKTPSLESPLGDLHSSASSIASAVNGMTKAEIAQAQADATNASVDAAINVANKDEREFADQGKWLAAQRENSAREVQADLDYIDAKARLAALRGWHFSAKGEPDYTVEGQGFKNLIKQYEGQLDTGAYQSQVWRSYMHDMFDAAGSISGAYRNFRPATYKGGRR